MSPLLWQDKIFRRRYRQRGRLTLQDERAGTKAVRCMHVYPPDTYQKFAATLEQTQWLSRADLDRYQQNLLTRLVEFAYAHSPFYRERLQPLFAHGGKGPRLEAWEEIPLLRREDLTTSLDRITPEYVPPEAGPVEKIETSGTSGPRMPFHTCMLSRIAAEGMMYRHYSWHASISPHPWPACARTKSGRPSRPAKPSRCGWQQNPERCIIRSTYGSRWKTSSRGSASARRGI
jgi:hypothetical protein